MQTNIYIDGFNLYYGGLKGTSYKWLDVALLCATLLPKNQINRIRYFTAEVKPFPNNPQQLQRQQTYTELYRCYFKHSLRLLRIYAIL